MTSMIRSAKGSRVRKPLARFFTILATRLTSLKIKSASDHSEKHGQKEIATATDVSGITTHDKIASKKGSEYIEKCKGNYSGWELFYECGNYVSQVLIALASVLAATFAALAFRAALKSNGYARLAAHASQASERAHLGAEFVIHFEPSQKHINDGSYRCVIDIHTYLLNFGRTPAENIKIISFDWRVVDSEAIHNFTPDQEIRTDQVHKGSYLPSQDRRLINRRHYSGFFNPEKYYVRRDERKSIVAAKLEFSYSDMFGNKHVVKPKAQFYGSARRTLGVHKQDSENLVPYGSYNFDNTNPIYCETQRTETPNSKKKTIK